MAGQAGAAGLLSAPRWPDQGTGTRINPNTVCLEPNADYLRPVGSRSTSWDVPILFLLQARESGSTVSFSIASPIDMSTG